ncbi:hypothetical protein D9M68_881380 [compost metagenome]
MSSTENGAATRGPLYPEPSQPLSARRSRVNAELPDEKLADCIEYIASLRVLSRTVTSQVAPVPVRVSWARTRTMMFVLPGTETV